MGELFFWVKRRGVAPSTEEEFFGKGVLFGEACRSNKFDLNKGENPWLKREMVGKSEVSDLLFTILSQSYVINHRQFTRVVIFKLL